MSEYGIGAYEASVAAVFSGGNPERQLNWQHQKILRI